MSGYFGWFDADDQEFAWRSPHPPWGRRYLKEECYKGEIRTVSEHPYTYSPILIWGDVSEKNGVSSVYNDRMQQWDADKYRMAFRDAFTEQGGCYTHFRHINRNALNNFLTIYFGKPVEIVAVIEYCRPDNGYQIWRFDYKGVMP